MMALQDRDMSEKKNVSFTFIFVYLDGSYFKVLVDHEPV